jgi:predicted alternative tryptophan synthase beta-subunit
MAEEQIKYLLDESAIPTHWVNLLPDLPGESLLPLRVRGIERVRLHADLTILAALSCALARARAAPLAA